MPGDLGPGEWVDEPGWIDDGDWPDPAGRGHPDRGERRGGRAPGGPPPLAERPRSQRDDPMYGLDETEIVHPAMLGLPPQRGAPPDWDHDVDDYDFPHDEELEEERQPVREWLVTIGQLVVGACAGAVLWLVFRWMWRFQPTFSAVLGVLVTVAAVLLVRRIWRSNDARTIVMTVLIGLFVTMSPAVLLLDL